MLDFEEPPVGTLTDFYGRRGGTFNEPQVVDYSDRPGFAHSGSKAVEQCLGIEFCTTPLTFTFNVEQKRAKLWVGSSLALAQARTVVLQALDANGTFITQQVTTFPASTAPIPVQNPLEVFSAAANIKQLVVKFGPAGSVGGLGSTGAAANNGLVIDDLEIFGEAGVVPCAEGVRPPTIGLEHPKDNTVVNVNKFLFQGLWGSTAPLTQAVLAVRSGPNTRQSDLMGTFNQFDGFFNTFKSGLLTPGENTVRVFLRNCAGPTNSEERKVFYSPIVNGTGFKLLGLEVVQATQDSANSMPLVANKATIVRVYLSVTGPTAAIGGVTGAITATPPGSSTPIPPLLESMNAITVTSSQDRAAKSVDLNATLNFAVPPEWTAGRTLHFQLLKIFIQGEQTQLPCDGCSNLDSVNAPRHAHFNPTRPINLVLAPHVYVNGLTPDMSQTLTSSLQWMNNVYPLSGNFPADVSGINIARILPMGSLDRTMSPSDAAGGSFLDNLELFQIWLRVASGSSLPDDFHLLALTPCACGGRADTGGRAAWADTWSVENGMVPQDQIASYGQLWSHELGHNLGREHAGTEHDEDADDGFLENLGEDIAELFLGPSGPFAYPHGGIGLPGVALTTEYWHPPLFTTPYLIPPGDLTSDNHAHEFMSYGLAPHWVSPYTYDALFRHFVITASSAAPQAPSEKLIVSGRIGADGSATLKPMYRVTTGYTSAADPAGKLSIDLLDASGRVLSSQKFNADKAEDGRSVSFGEVVPWTSGAQEIVLKTRTRILAKRVVSRNAPRVKIASPRGGAWDGKGVVSWAASDGDGDPLSFTVLYSPDGKDDWLPIAAGVKAYSAAIDTRFLPGSKRARLRVVASDGVNTAIAETGALAVADKPALVAIHSPRDGASVSAAAVELTGFVYDPEDRVLGDRSLTWSSDRDGVLGRGRAIKPKVLSPGAHVISLTAIDSQKTTAVARVKIYVVRDAEPRAKQSQPK